MTYLHKYHILKGYVGIFVVILTNFSDSFGYPVVVKCRVGGLLIESSFSVIINLFASMQIKAHFDYNVTVAMQK